MDSEAGVVTLIIGYEENESETSLPFFRVNLESHVTSRPRLYSAYNEPGAGDLLTTDSVGAEIVCPMSQSWNVNLFETLSTTLCRLNIFMIFNVQYFHPP